MHSYNCAMYIEISLISALSLICTNSEFIVTDDNSDDIIFPNY